MTYSYYVLEVILQIYTLSSFNVWGYICSRPLRVKVRRFQSKVLIPVKYNPHTHLCNKIFIQPKSLGEQKFHSTQLLLHCRNISSNKWVAIGSMSLMQKENMIHIYFHLRTLVLWILYPSYHVYHMYSYHYNLHTDVVHCHLWCMRYEAKRQYLT